MGRGFLLSCATILGVTAVSGCGLPLPLVVATYAVDSAVLVASDKMISDHMLSAVADEDCAIWRVVTWEEVCVAYGDGDAIIATAAAPAETRPQPLTVLTYTAADELRGMAALPQLGAPIAYLASVTPAGGFDDVRPRTVRRVVAERPLTSPPATRPTQWMAPHATAGR